MLFIRPKDDQTIETGNLTTTLDGVQGSAFSTIPDLGELSATQFDLNRVIGGTDSPPWELVVSQDTLEPDAIDDLYLLLTYTVESS